MPRFHLTVRRGMIVVGFLAVVCAAVRGNSDAVAAIFHAIAVVSLAVATLGAIVRSPRRRVRWVGYAAFGWTYYIALYVRDVTLSQMFPDDLVYALSRSIGVFPAYTSVHTDLLFPAYRIIRWALLMAFAGGGAALAPLLAGHREEAVEDARRTY